MRPTGSLFEIVDGDTWTKHPLPTADRLEHVTYAERLYVVVEKSSNTHTNPDLATWTARPLPSESQLKREHFDGTRFYTFDSLRRAPLVSTDGIIWEIPEEMPLMTGRQAQPAPYLGIYFVISGFLQWLPPGAAYIEWQSNAFSSRLSVSQLTTSDDSTVVAVKNYGLIMSSAPRGGSFSDWIAGHFSVTNANHQIDADPDNDGQSSLEEYVAGTSPTIFTTPQSTSVINFREGGATLSWKQAAEAEGVKGQVETSENLQAWQTVGDVTIDARSEIRSATVDLSTSGVPSYYRLRWELE